MIKCSIFIFYGLLALQMGNAQQKINLLSIPDTLSLFQEGNISGSLYERDMAISPDGRELFYTILVPKSGFCTIIYMFMKADGTWSNPETASFSGNYSDMEPAFSADGKRIYFASNRPLSGNKTKDFDIWYVEKISNKWTNPKNIGAPVNTSVDEFYPAIAENSNLYFTAAYKKSNGKEDIYISKYLNGSYSDPVALDTTINSVFDEFNAYVSPDEKYILFSSQGRKDDTGRGDLYISIKDNNSRWSPAKNLKFLNSSRLDYSPFLSFDKKILFISSDRHALPSFSTRNGVTYNELINFQKATLNGECNIYWISFDKVLENIK